jgi:hypothetical protein
LCRHHHRLRINTVTPHFSLGIPISVWGSPNQNGDPQTEMGMHHKQSPNRFGDPRTEMGIKTSPYQNGDPRIGLGIVQSLTHSDSGFIPIWDFRVLSPIVPKLERHSKRGPHIGTGIPESVWVGICQYSKLGSPHSDSGFIPIWGPTYTRCLFFFNPNYTSRKKSLSICTCF